MVFGGEDRKKERPKNSNPHAENNNNARRSMQAILGMRGVTAHFWIRNSEAISSPWQEIAAWLHSRSCHRHAVVCWEAVSNGLARARWMCAIGDVPCVSLLSLSGVMITGT